MRAFYISMPRCAPVLPGAQQVPIGARQGRIIFWIECFARCALFEAHSALEFRAHRTSAREVTLASEPCDFDFEVERCARRSALRAARLFM
jgi:hypothetical protein